jgi:2-polyprenyl-3-methyl-5-hydroxy-6-metoxy-1,4-benzoquinol methylase
MAKQALANRSREMKPATPQRYVPALRFGWLTRFYDPVVAMTTRETTFRQRLLDQANLRPGTCILDLACGSGTMATLIKQQYP